MTARRGLSCTPPRALYDMTATWGPSDTPVRALESTRYMWQPHDTHHREAYPKHHCHMSALSDTPLRVQYLQDICDSLMIHTTERPTLNITVTWAPYQIRLWEPNKIGLPRSIEETHICECSLIRGVDTCHYMHCISISGANDFFGYLYIFI